LGFIILNLDRPAQSGQSFGKTSHRNPAFGQETFDIPVAGIKSIVEPDGAGNDIGWGGEPESVALIGVQPRCYQFGPVNLSVSTF